MCGICGIIDHQRIIPFAQRAKFTADMNEAIRHRGPDGAGQYANEGCHLAMRRLAIIDLKTGDQPVFNEDGRIGIFFNGEIYNYRELREELLKQGHQFQTDSDTEVLVHLYEEKGVEMLPLLKGMFAFCLFDKTDNTYLLARDRFGEKPLFYHEDEGVLSFASEIRALLQNPRIPRRLNAEALPYYFRTSLIPEPITLLDGIYSLLPGHYLLFRNGNSAVYRYFDLRFEKTQPPVSEQEAIDRIGPLLARAVKRQTVSDVPIAAFLSGGIDSSTVVALLQEQSSERIRTFHVRFEDQAYDESRIAAKVADYCGTDHREIVVPNYDFREEIFWMILDHVGVPFRDSSAIPTYLISRAIGEEVKVALSGDGGDELFGGYSLFQWYRQILQLQAVPELIRNLADSALETAKKLPGLGTWSRIRQLHRAVGTSLLHRKDIPIALNEMFSDPASLYRTGMPNGLDYSRLKAYPPSHENWTDLREIMYYRMRHTLPANMLVKVDRMSMAASLEVRAPFLDPDLFQAASRLPDDLLIRGGKGKYLIRKIMENRLPADVFDHPKTGFNIPLYKYQNEAFKQLALDLLFTPSPLHEILDTGQLEAIFQRGIGQRQDSAEYSVFQSAHQLWMMMQLFGWMRRYQIGL